ncbi:glycosyltransferase family protein [Nakamurella alba]|uniref:glycosyltransferase family protein n=1 Tax=Nakamurella alba TaxID=2665158 RepID=UPI0018AAC1B2|nr:glycosyltransferase [Nakamurella alba]
MKVTTTGPVGGPRRIAFYSHDTQGLGHIRRNITLAAAMSAGEDCDILLLTGNPEATTLPLPDRTDVVTLPTVAKDKRGRYAARVMGSSLRRITAMRSGIIDAALRAFDPDVLVVDKAAGGVCGELEPVLARLRAAGRTRTVLGLRDILDEPDVVHREWRDQRTVETITAFYDQVWVYGDRDVHDLTAEHPLVGAVGDRVVFTGYLGEGRADGLRPRVRTEQRVRPPAGPYVLGLVGGGQDGLAVAEAFAGARPPAGHSAVLVTGPYLPRRHRERLRALAAGRTDLQLLEFIPDADEFIAGAAAVVSMAGYNTVCELLQARVPALLVPRVIPRREQWIRAERLAARGACDLLDPALLTADTLTTWLATAVSRPATDAAPIDLSGLHRVPGLCASLLQEAHRAA